MNVYDIINKLENTGKSWFELNKQEQTDVRNKVKVLEVKLWEQIKRETDIEAIRKAIESYEFDIPPERVFALYKRYLLLKPHDAIMLRNFANFLLCYWRNIDEVEERANKILIYISRYEFDKASEVVKLVEYIE